jgi:hypothetical protein
MERKPSNVEVKIISIALFLLIGFLCQGVCHAAGSEPAGNEGQIEAVVIHVDEWAVYVPNQIFYFDTNMGKSKIETLKRVANQLRNRKALITYSSTGDLSKDKHAMLFDIVPAGEKRNPEKSTHEAVKPPNDSQGKEIPELSEKKVYSTETVPSQAQISDKQVAALVEALRLSAPNTGNPNDGLYSDWKIKLENILRWSKRCTGKEMEPAEFQVNTQEARAIIACIMGKTLREQYEISNDESVAVRRAASWWMTGDPNKYDTTPTTSYTMKVLGFYRRVRDQT